MTDEELSKCLEIEADRNCLRIQIIEAAAFLDTIAKRMWVRGEQRCAADCRAMAHKLRGET